MIEAAPKIEKFKKPIKRIAAVGLMGLVGVGASGCGAEEVHTYKDSRELAKKRYQRAYRNTDPAHKFIMQYLRKSVVDVAKDRYGGGAVDKYYEFTMNDACLQSTAYDIAGGSLEMTVSMSGLFSTMKAEAHGKFPTAAANAFVDSKNPDILNIAPGREGTASLRFSGLADSSPLTPADKQTEDALATWGCKEYESGVTIKKHRVVHAYNAVIPNNNGVRLVQ